MIKSGKRNGSKLNAQKSQENLGNNFRHSRTYHIIDPVHARLCFVFNWSRHAFWRQMALVEWGKIKNFTLI